jgi:hypothetical protein
MKTIFGLACAALLGVSACGTTAEEERQSAELHEYRARQAADHGDYQRAADEQRRAAEAREKYYAKAVKEGQYPPVPATGP